MKTALFSAVFLVATFARFSVTPSGAAEPPRFPREAATPTTPGTPAEVLRVFLEAIKAQDVEAFKKTLSTGGLAVMGDRLASQKVTPAELLKALADDGLLPGETNDEKIKGDTATIDVKRGKKEGEWHTVALIKEDGNWKVALGNWEEESAGKDKPADAWLKFLEALKSGSSDMFEKCVAPASLDKFKQSAGVKKQGLGQAVGLLGRKLPQTFDPIPTRNEMIGADGATATLEVKDPTREDHWVRLHFVKGDDRAWKITFTDDHIGEVVPGESVP